MTATTTSTKPTTTTTPTPKDCNTNDDCGDNTPICDLPSGKCTKCTVGITITKMPNQGISC